MSTNLTDAFIGEMAHEAETTRKLLERVPEDKLDYKPHEKSMTLGRLASHVAEVAQWAGTIANDDLFDMDAMDYKPPECSTQKELLDLFNSSIETFNGALKGKTDEHMMGIWKMKAGGNIALEMPRVVCLRSFVMSHLIHHRGQLSVYLRANDVPLPSIYGPSADDPGM